MTRPSDLALKKLWADDDEVVKASGNDKNLSKSKISKNVKSRIQMQIGTMRELTFLNPGAKEAFNQLR